MNNFNKLSLTLNIFCLKEEGKLKISVYSSNLRCWKDGFEIEEEQTFYNFPVEIKYFSLELILGFLALNCSPYALINLSRIDFI